MHFVRPIAPTSVKINEWLVSSAFPTTWTLYFKRRQQQTQELYSLGTPLLNSRNRHLYTGSASKTFSIELSPRQLFVTNLKNLFKNRLLNAFPFDGYETSSTIITSADGSEIPYTGDSLPLWVILTSVLGLPNRPATVIDGVPRLTLAQFFRNFVGGWNPVYFKDKLPDQKLADTAQKSLSLEKKIWQFLAIPFKIAFILPIKIIAIPFKILLNAVKLVTEIFLPFFSLLLGYVNMRMIDAVPKLASLAIVETLSSWRTASNGERYAEFQPNGKISIPRLLGLLIPLILLSVLTLAVWIIQYASVLTCRMGFALTSPAESAKKAFALGRRLDIGIPLVSNILGVLGALVSLSLSAVLWTMALPLTLGALVTVIPQLLTAITWLSQVPFIANSLAWISQFPLVTGSATLLNNLFGTVGTALGSAFGPAVSALATVISVQIPAVALVVGTTLGLLLTPLVATLSLGADKLSNLWATWIESGPFTALFSMKMLRSSAAKTNKMEAVPLAATSVASARLVNENEVQEVFLYRDLKSSRGFATTYVVSPVILRFVATHNSHLECAFTLSNYRPQPAQPVRVRTAAEVYNCASRGWYFKDGAAAGSAEITLRLPTQDELRDAADTKDLLNRIF